MRVCGTLACQYQQVRLNTADPEALIITGGVPEGITNFTETTESDSLSGDIACAGKTTIDCLAAGSEGTSTLPGMPTVGMLLPLTNGGHTRSWSPGNPTGFYPQSAVGVIVAP